MEREVGRVRPNAWNLAPSDLGRRTLDPARSFAQRSALMHCVAHMDMNANGPASEAAHREEPLAAERERVVQTLSAHFAHDQLTMAEFEQRLERAYELTAVDQLRSLVADLPALAMHAGSELSPGPA